MKKISVLSILFIISLTLIACSSDDEAADEREKFTYESEEGDVEVYESPERVVVLSAFLTGHVLAADGNVVGAPNWDFMNETYESYLEDTTEISEDDVEGIVELEPDLILAQPDTANLDQLREIAPTVVFTYGNLDYLEQYEEVATLLGEEEEAETWIEDFQSEAQAMGEDIKDKHGEDTTVSVIESYEKELYVYGDNWGRGTEILYQEMELEMPEEVREDALEPGYYTISPEVVADYMGDFVVLSEHTEADTSFEDTSTFQSTDAYQNDQILEVDGTAFSYNDPLTLEWQLETFEDFFLND
ncbi:MAG: ABC transporter substrate-binding protein [Bacillota bacterium]